MSNFDDVRTELARTERGETSRLKNYAVIAVLILAVAAGLAEIDLLPTFSADDFASILFGAG